jgi:ribosomal protein S18 acetylase RimI-like enzyme
MNISLHASGSGAVCADILAELPDWFGIDEANEDYVVTAESHETLIATDGGRAVGLLTLKTHSPYAAEIYLVAVRRALHRGGVGRALVAAAEDLLRARGVEFLQVKTLSPSREDAGYEKTRLFYEALGFRWLEEFPDLWDPENPALQMIKAL